MNTRQASEALLPQLSIGDAVILVHGTFARDALWTRHDSELATAIRSKFPEARVLAFNWSGKNSPAARIKAGRELAALAKQLRELGCQRIWIISHSHGGNVALYSLREPLMRSTVAGICFYGTPFFDVAQRPVERFSTIVTETASWLLLFPGFMPIGAMFLVNLISNPLFGGAMLLFGNGLLVLAYLIVRPRIRRAAHSRLTATLKNVQARALEWFRPPEPMCATLIASIKWDEAGLLLRSFDALAAAPWIAFGVAARTVGVVALTVIGLMFLEMLIYGDTVGRLDADVSLFLLSLGLASFVVFGPPVITVFASLVRGSPVAFGYEGLISGATLRIVPTPLPSWSRRDHGHYFYTAAPGSIRGLRHSIFYNDFQVIDATVKWLAGQVNNLAEGAPFKGQKDLPRFGIRLTRWFVPGLTAASLIILQEWLTLAKIGRANEPQLDIQPSSELFWNVEPEATVFDIDSEFSKQEESFGELFAPPAMIDPKIELPPSAHCLMGGEFKFSNWGTTINVSIHDTTNPRFNDFPFDMENPNHVKITYDFIRRDVHREIWEWYSPQGTTVSFRREFANRFKRPGTLLIRIWNESTTPVRVTGQLKMTCLPIQ